MFCHHVMYWCSDAPVEKKILLCYTQLGQNCQEYKFNSILGVV